MEETRLHVGATAIFRGVIRVFDALGHASLTEVTLANGRRVDVMALGPKGEVTIIEVKSCRSDFMTDQKWPEYQAFCDRFFFAVDAAFPQDILPEETGLIIADGFGGAVIRDAPEHRLAPARRKAVTLKLAQLGAQRLAALQGLV